MSEGNKSKASDDTSHWFHGQCDMLNKRYDYGLLDPRGQNISHSALNMMERIL